MEMITFGRAVDKKKRKLGPSLCGKERENTKSVPGMLQHFRGFGFMSADDSRQMQN